MSGPPAADHLADPEGVVRLGKYLLVRHIATGGMAEVDLARVDGPEGIERLAVVKRVLPRYARDEDYMRMFLDEVRIAGSLQHPNVVQVYDVGFVAGQYFMAMEYLRGHDLASLLQAATASRLHLPVDFSVGVMCCVCAGLDYAHRKRSWGGRALGIVHRDVSPQNVFVTHEGNVKVVDFGLARAADRVSETRAGVIKGKYGYMAPEQVGGKGVDLRADIYSAGIVLWELITGRRLFKADHAVEAMREIREKGVPSPLEFRPDCPPGIEAVIRRALSRDPERRYQTARAFQEELERAAQQAALWLSPLRRAAVMEAYFPGESGSAMSELTVATRKPTPLRTLSIDIADPHALGGHGRGTPKGELPFVVGGRTGLPASWRRGSREFVGAIGRGWNGALDSMHRLARGLRTLPGGSARAGRVSYLVALIALLCLMVGGAAAGISYWAWQDVPSAERAGSAGGALESAERSDRTRGPRTRRRRPVRRKP